MLRGEAGVGKTALLRYLSDRAEGCHVAQGRRRRVGDGARLQRPPPALRADAGQLDRLPEPQRDALATVFGRSAGPAPDRFLVGLATLTLLAEVAEQQPLVCIVDDAQWLDGASAQIFGFVARRLLAERIALVCAARTGHRRRRPRRASRAAGRRARRDRRTRAAAGERARPARRRGLRADHHGEPRKPARAARAAAHAGASPTSPAGSGCSRATGGRQDRAELRRAPRRASRPSRDCSSSPRRPSRSATRSFSTAPPRRSGSTWRAVEPAVDAGLLKLGVRVEFAHPLVRSAAYRTATAEDRHRVHRALGEATDVETDPDRRAWHRAHATARARRGRRRRARAVGRAGRRLAAASRPRPRSCSSALTLTADPARRAERALAAAQASLQAGAFDAALEALAHGGGRTARRVRSAPGPISSGGASPRPRASASAAARAAQGGEAARAARRRARARDLPRGWGNALAAGGLAAAGTLRDVSQRRPGAPRPGARPVVRPTCCSTG